MQLWEGVECPSTPLHGRALKTRRGKGPARQDGPVLDDPICREHPEPGHSQGQSPRPWSQRVQGGRGGTPTRQVRCSLLGEDTAVTLDRGSDGDPPPATRHRAVLFNTEMEEEDEVCKH